MPLQHVLSIVGVKCTLNDLVIEIPTRLTVSCIHNQLTLVSEGFLADIKTSVSESEHH